MKSAFLAEDEDWARVKFWDIIKMYSPDYTTGYFLNAVDMEKTTEGVALRDEDERIYGLLFKRTIFMSLVITFSCIALGYPVAWLLANLPARTANLLMILVLLPFWTSLLVRTSAWKVMLQQQGVINDTLVWLGLVADESRLVMINNQFGTIVAMTHILLPFMILPMYSVMQTIPPSYLRAARSLGARPFTAFWRVYFPQSVPGIGAGGSARARSSSSSSRSATTSRPRSSAGPPAPSSPTGSPITSRPRSTGGSRRRSGRSCWSWC